MNIFPLAAVIAALALPVAAQTDAAFAAALGEAPAGLEAAAQLKTKPQAPAAQALAAPADVWKKIVARVKAISEYSPIIDGIIVEDFLGNPKGNRSQHVITLFGSPDANGAFVFEEACIEFSETTLDPKDGNWHGASWTFYVDPAGKVVGRTYGESVRTPDERVLSGGPVKLDSADPRVAARFDAMIKYWSTR